MPASSRRLTACMGALLASSVATAHADPTGEDSKRADALFDEGTKAMEGGDYARACPALQQSLAIDPAAGTALALARCHEKAGRIATAWRAYLDAESRARAAGQIPRADAARDQAAALAPRLPHLAITLSAQVASSAGLVVELDGLPIGATSLGTQLPIDPGAHRVEARADGKAPSVRTVTLAEGESQSIAIASFEAAAPAGPASPSAIAPEEDDGPRPLQIAGFVVGGVGVVGLGVGAVLGLLASGKSSDSDATCKPFTDGTGGSHADYENCVDQRDAAGSLADGSTIAFIAGGVLAAGGVGLVLLDGTSDHDEAALVLVPGPTSISARGAF